MINVNKQKKDGRDRSAFGEMDEMVRSRGGDWETRHLSSSLSLEIELHVLFICLFLFYPVRYGPMDYTASPYIKKNKTGRLFSLSMSGQRADF